MNADESARRSRTQGIEKGWLKGRVPVEEVKAKYVVDRQSQPAIISPGLPGRPTESDLNNADRIIAGGHEPKWVNILRDCGVAFEDFQGPDPARNRANLAMAYQAWIEAARRGWALRWRLVWGEMLDAMQEGDELWEFSSPHHFWDQLAGRAEVALVRNGEIVDCIVTSVN
jgi:hypothetical protein